MGRSRSCYYKSGIEMKFINKIEFTDVPKVFYDVSENYQNLFKAKTTCEWNHKNVLNKGINIQLYKSVQLILAKIGSRISGFVAVVE